MRQIGVSYSGFVDESYTLLSLFDDVEQIEKIIDFRQLLMLSENSLVFSHTKRNRPN